MANPVRKKSKKHLLSALSSSSGPWLRRLPLMRIALTVILAFLGYSLLVLRQPTEASTLLSHDAACIVAPTGADIYYNVERCLAQTRRKRHNETLELIAKMPPEKLDRFRSYDGWRTFDFFQPSYFCNAMDLARIGGSSKMNDTGKWICTDKIDYDSRNECVAFSFGSNGQFDYEEEIARIFPDCKQHTFDCTGYWSHQNTTFHQWCLGGKNEFDAKGRRFYTLSTITEMLHVESISLLKMDIEDFEYRVLYDMLQVPVATRPKQILVEFHTWQKRKSWEYYAKLVPELFSGLEVSQNWALPMIRTLRLIHELGYHIAFIERNRWGQFAAEVILIHETAL